MKKVVLFGCIALIGIGSCGASEIINVQEKNIQREYKEDNEKYLAWKEGFTKTKGMVYVPESYEAAYNALVNIFNERKEKEGLQANIEDLVYKEEKLIGFIKEQSKIVPQDYPAGTMLSPSVDLVGSGGYYNNIIFIPSKHLVDYKSGKEGLIKAQFNLICEQIDNYEEGNKKADENLTEVMELTCSIDQLPRNIDVFYYPRDILRLWQPTIKIDSDNQTVEIFNDGDYKSFLYVFGKDGSVITSHDDIFSEEVNSISVNRSDIEKIVYLFFLDDFIPDNPSDPFTTGTSFYWPKIVIYNIV